jgi:hypothetical protein
LQRYAKTIVGQASGRSAVRAPFTDGPVRREDLAGGALNPKLSSKLIAVCTSFQAGVVGRGTAGVKKRVCKQAVPRPTSG